MSAIVAQKNKLLGSEQAYHHVHNAGDMEAARAMSKNLTKGYTMWFDKIFSRGIMGVIFSLWTIALGIINVLQFIEATSITFLVTFILTIVELGVVVIFTGILSYLSYRVDQDKKRLRYIQSVSGAKIPAKDLINATRSRGNVVADFDLLTTGLGFILFEFVAVLVVYVGDAFLLSNSTAVPHLLASTGLYDVRMYVVAKIIYGVMLVKAAVVLGQAIKRATADAIASLRLKQESNIDANKLEADGSDVTVDGETAIKLSSKQSDAATLI
jgi:hypothetical protein